MPDQPQSSKLSPPLPNEAPVSFSAPESSTPGTEVPTVVKPRRTLREATRDLIKTLLPEKVSKLGDDYGPSLFLGFALGLVAGIIFATGTLMGSESLRTVLLPPPTKDGAPGSGVSTVPREKLADITFTEVDSPPVFFQDYERLLVAIGKAEQPAGTLDNPPMGAVALEINKPTEAFVFPLEPRITGSQVYAYLFRRSRVGASDLFEPLISLPGSDVKKIRFRVPECDAGDKLFMIVLVIPPTQHSSVDKFTDYFRTGPPE